MPDATVPERAGPGPAARWRAPLLWRCALRFARVLVGSVARLRVTGDVPADLRGGPLILVANHIGAFDPAVLAAACAKRGIAPRILATGGLFRAPVVGTLMRHCGHIRVNRRHANVTDALAMAVAAIGEGSVVLAYPEGGITLDPGMWPERGKTGVARLAVASGAPVVPVAQWGAHLVLPWGAPRGMLGRLVWSVLHRPVVRVHFGAPIDLSGVGQGARAIRHATDRIMDAVVEGLGPLRGAEPRLPAWTDMARPVSTARTHRVRSRPDPT